MNYEDDAVNVAEHFDIPFATLHIFPLRANGQLLPFLPAPLARSAMRVLDWVAWRGPKKVEDAQRREFGLPKATRPGRNGSPNADGWKSRPSTRCATPGWQPNGRNGMGSGPPKGRLSVR